MPLYLDVRVCCWYIGADNSKAAFYAKLEGIDTHDDPNTPCGRHRILKYVARIKKVKSLLNAIDVQCINVHYRGDRNLPCLVCMLYDNGFIEDAIVTKIE